LGGLAGCLGIPVVGVGGGALNHVLAADLAGKGLLVVGDIGALVVGGANTVVSEEVLGRASACALQL
jgi:hypothetical protein